MSNLIWRDEESGRHRSLRRSSSTCQFSSPPLCWRHHLFASRILNYGTASPIRPSVNRIYYLISRILHYFYLVLLTENILREIVPLCVGYFVMFSQNVSFKPCRGWPNVFMRHAKLFPFQFPARDTPFPVLIQLPQSISRKYKTYSVHNNYKYNSFPKIISFSRDVQW
jgi:hypothetical protein